MAAQKISERFCAPDADITISSSDGVLFKVHRKNLEVHSDIFADAANAARPDNVGEEVVILSETSAVLDVLFQYMYRQPQPNLQLVDFETFAGVAEAAEKYVVYSALTLCQMRMKDSIISHPLEVLRYAVKHDHVDLANESAQQSMSCEVAKAMEVLPLDNFKSWILFYEQWQRRTSECLSPMVYEPNAQALLYKCIRDRNPVFTYRKELNERDVVRPVLALKFIPDGKEEWQIFGPRSGSALF